MQTLKCISLQIHFTKILKLTDPELVLLLVNPDTDDVCNPQQTYPLRFLSLKDFSSSFPSKMTKRIAKVTIWPRASS